MTVILGRGCDGSDQVIRIGSVCIGFALIQFLVLEYNKENLADFLYFSVLFPVRYSNGAPPDGKSCPKEQG
jgi:hypothetical protein